MVDLPPASHDGLLWTLKWLEATLSGESEVINADELDRLDRDLIDRSAQNPRLGTSAATAAASVAVQLFELLTERDPQTAGEYLRDLRHRLTAM
jgi:hypothetical protein